MQQSRNYEWVRIVLAIILGLLAGVMLDRQVLGGMLPAGAAPAQGVDLRLVSEAYNAIQRHYVDRPAIQPQKMTYAAIGGMVDSLGDTGHSQFLTPEMLKAERNFTRGQFEGVGIEVQVKDQHIVIVAPIDGSPAQQAGLRAGEIIQKVNGEPVTGLPLEQVVQRVLGPAGTQVTLTIQDPTTNKTRDVTLTRAKITLRNVTWQVIPGTKVAHVRLAAFSNGVTDDLKKALDDMQKQGAQAVVLDLRNNPGGLLEEAIGTTSQFVSSGNVLLQKDAQGQVEPVPVRAGGAAIQMPVIILINGGTASASEIVSGALQDAGRAQLVGEKTFGTGTVLSEFKLSDGSALLLAIKEWLTPKGRVIWHDGIAPDVTVANPADAPLLVPEAERDMTPAQFTASGDAQLLRALDIIQKSIR